MKKININTASEKELIALPKIGPTTAKRIIAFRNKTGLFKRKDEIKEVDGISDAIFEGFRNQIFASSVGLKKTSTTTTKSSPARSRSARKSQAKSTKTVSEKVVKKPAGKKTTRSTTKSTMAKPTLAKKTAINKEDTKSKTVAKPRVSIKSDLKKSRPKSSSAARKPRPLKKAEVQKTSPKVKAVAKSITKKSSPKNSTVNKNKSSKRKAPSTRISKIQKVVSAKKKSTAVDSKTKAPILPKSKVSIPRKTERKTNQLLDSVKKKTVNTIKKYAKDFIKTGKEKPSIKKQKSLSPIVSVKANSKEKVKSPTVLSSSQLKDLAKSNKIEPAVLKAIMQIESGGKGFLKNGKVKILFHGQSFYQLLKDAKMKPNTLIKDHKNLIQKKSSNKSNKGGKSAYKKLRSAKKIHKSAALQACSYGLFQLMGSSYKEAGFKSVKAFVKAHKSSEKAQLKAFLKAAKSQKALKDLRNKDWKKFTEKFVTSEYSSKKYAKKLAKTYKQQKSKK